MAEGMDTAALYKNRRPGKRCFAEYNLGFLQDMRRFLKSDEDMVPAVQYRIRHNPDDHGVDVYKRQDQWRVCCEPYTGSEGYF